MPFYIATTENLKKLMTSKAIYKTFTIHQLQVIKMRLHFKSTDISRMILEHSKKDILLEGLKKDKTLLKLNDIIKGKS